MVATEAEVERASEVVVEVVAKVSPQEVVMLLGELQEVIVELTEEVEANIEEVDTEEEATHLIDASSMSWRLS